MVHQGFAGGVNTPEPLEDGLEVLLRQLTIATPLEGGGLGSPKAAR